MSSQISTAVSTIDGHSLVNSSESYPWKGPAFLRWVAQIKYQTWLSHVSFQEQQMLSQSYNSRNLQDTACFLALKLNLLLCSQTQRWHLLQTVQVKAGSATYRSPKQSALHNAGSCWQCKDNAAETCALLDWWPSRVHVDRSRHIAGTLSAGLSSCGSMARTMLREAASIHSFIHSNPEDWV